MHTAKDGANSVSVARAPSTSSEDEMEGESDWFDEDELTW